MQKFYIRPLSKQFCVPASFQKLVTVTFRHDYLDGAAYSNFTAVPDLATKQLLTRLRLMIRRAAGEVEIYFEHDPRTGDASSRLEELKTMPILLRFIFEFTDPYFLNYTDLQGNSSRMNNKFISIDSNNAGKVSGNLDIVVGPEMLEEIEIHFNTPAFYWNYVLASEQLQSLNNPLVRDASTGECFTNADLRSVSGGRAAKVLVSSKAIPIRQAPGLFFELVERNQKGKERIVINTLPTPDCRNLSFAPATTDSNGMDAFRHIQLFLY
jgi:hypothetical protein